MHTPPPGLPQAFDTCSLPLPGIEPQEHAGTPAWVPFEKPPVHQDETGDQVRVRKRNQLAEGGSERASDQDRPRHAQQLHELLQHADQVARSEMRARRAGASADSGQVRATTR